MQEGKKLPLIKEKNIVKRIPIYCRKGRNAGRQTGEIIIEKYKFPYYFVIKNWKNSQLYQVPKHKNTLSVSEHILKKLEEYGVKNIVFMITAMEKRSFYYIVPLKNFWNGEKTEYDDPQYRIRMHNLPKYYPEQERIDKFL